MIDSKRPAWWLAIWPKNQRVRRAWELPHFGAVQDGFFYHDGGPGYMHHKPEEYHVLKDYGMMTLGAWSESCGSLYADFPPVESQPKEYGQDIESWVSPTGALYLCGSSGHALLADRLTFALNIRSPGTYNRADDVLEMHDWIRLYHDHVTAREPTQRQIDTLFDILVVLENKNEMHALCEQIRYTLGMQPRVRTPILHNAVNPPDVITEPAICNSDNGNTDKKAPFVLVDQPFVEITVRAYCTKEQLPSGREHGISCFKTFCTTVTSDDKDPAPSGEHGENIGMIGGGTGFVTLQDSRRIPGQDGEEFFIRHCDLWYAYQTALNKKYGPFDGQK